MTFLSKVQLAVIAGILILVVSLFLANTSPSQKISSAEVSVSNEIQIKNYIEQARETLTTEQKIIIQELEVKLDNGRKNEKITLLDSLIKSWSTFKQPVSAAYYAEQLAQLIPTAENWENAGNRYLAATRFIQPDKRNPVFKSAIDCFDKTLALNPKNTAAKMNMAISYVEGSSDPMKGISLLKEIEKTDSNNIQLQINFALFSEKSGQFEKAIQRYEKVLQIDSNYVEAYLHLADVHENNGDKIKAIENLEKYLTLVDDITIKTEVKNYINKLKTN